ncbi:PqqD family protein [Phycisphaera mikurensis]|uniref:PqqD family protein n=1 Tax=Phycisphaera mikurensis (strain NBRC 102666 / KCTC 22515 / FYK2301M01) TaxID=1142394 RepID=I0IF30_PHYMF|nr:PqqD family protein [Phycisphaera mikurensis]MBB6441659.1 hypothetical protein [Phycisphaera mikurensis]BAM03868.1 hypothetical protein PSMK_17090 [Phycisphaera mikurensis NBRC 102666]
MKHRRPVSQQAARQQARRREAQAALHTPQRLLAATARPAAAATARPRGDGLRVTRPAARPWWAFPPISWVVPVPQTRTVDLDPLGREVYELLGRGRRVEEVIEAFAEAHKLPFAEAQESVSAFLRLLLARDLVELDAASR